MLCFLEKIKNSDPYQKKSTISLWHNIVKNFEIIDALCNKKTIGLLIKEDVNNFFIFCNNAIIIAPKHFYNIEYI